MHGAAIPPGGSGSDPGDIEGNLGWSPSGGWDENTDEAIFGTTVRAVIDSVAEELFEQSAAAFAALGFRAGGYGRHL